MTKYIAPNDPPPDGCQWRPLPGHPDYEVSEWGHLRRIAGPSNAPRGLKRFWRTNNNFWQTHLHTDRKKTALSAHRLVCMAFYGPPPFRGAEACHNDDVRENNHYTNLRWDTHKANCADRTRNGGAAIGARNGTHTHPHKVVRGERMWNAKLDEQKVRLIRTSPLAGAALARSLGLSRTTVNQVRRGETWGHVK
jgi:hypothetical protein